MQHNPLLGSVFRGSVKQFNEPEDILTPLKRSGLLGQSPPEIVRRREILTTKKPNRPETNTAKRPKTNIVSPYVHKRASYDDMLSTIRSNVTISRNTPSRPYPKLFYRKHVSNTEPPAPANFLQLQEFLEKAVKTYEDEDKVLMSYETVFLEIIRQYFIECSTEGKLLDRTRIFFNSMTKFIPKMKANFDSVIKEKNKAFIKLEEDITKLREEIIPANEESAKTHLQLNELKADLSTLVSHLDNLNSTIVLASKDSQDIKAVTEHLDQKIAEQNQILLKLNQEIKSLDEVSSKCTTDTIQIADYLNSTKIQLDINKNHLRNHQNTLETLESQLYNINSEIKETENIIEMHNKPAIKLESATQTDLVSRFRSSDKYQQKMKSLKYPNPNPNPITKLSENLVVPMEGIKVSTYEEFAQLKDSIIQNAQAFQMTPQEIKMAEEGTIPLTSPNPVRLFASKLITDVIYKTTRAVPKSSLSTQTLAKQPISQQPSKPVLDTTFQTGFAQKIPADYSDREPQSLEWLIKAIRVIYDEKRKRDVECLEASEKLEKLSDFVLSLSKRQNNLDFLAFQYCWDLNNTVLAHRDTNMEASLFSSALFGELTDEQLAFMLMCRDDVQKAGVPVSFEYYLSLDLVSQLMKKWFKHRFQPSMLTHLMEFAVSPPAAHLDAVKRYLSMTNILNVCVQEYRKDSIIMMGEIIMETRIVPRKTEAEFKALMEDLLPFLMDDEKDTLYRATVSKTEARTEVTEGQFIEKFKSNSILFYTEEKPSHNDEFIQIIEKTWDMMKERVAAVISFFEGSGNLVEDAKRFRTMLVHSISIKNEVEACSNYLQMLFSLELLASDTEIFDILYAEKSLTSLEDSVREYWMDSELRAM